VDDQALLEGTVADAGRCGDDVHEHAGATEAMLGDRHRRDRLAAVEEAKGASQDDRRVVPFGPGVLAERAVATMRVSISVVIASSVIRTAMVGPP